MARVKKISGHMLSEKIITKLLTAYRNLSFSGSANYWERRYRENGNSGVGSYGKNAEYKAAFINAFVEENRISRVLEFGCGDGNQLKYFRVPEYMGIDVSETAVKMCTSVFQDDAHKRFYAAHAPGTDKHIAGFNAELSLSLDVIFHLVEDAVFEQYMRRLFASSGHFVIIYSWDVDGKKKGHVRQRNFTKWVSRNIPEYRLINSVKDKENNFCDLFVYERGMI